MAIYPKNFNGQDRLQPGARGEIFQSDIPGYRNQGDRINRTHNNLNVSAHDVPNIKWELDRRLPVLFRDGYAFGYNQVTLPKGRIVALDPYMNLLDSASKKAYNVLTLANGGSYVKLRDKMKLSQPQDDKQWELVTGKVVKGTDKEDIYISSPVRPENITLDDNTGKLKVDGNVKDDYRAPNVPIGMAQRTEYTRNDDAFNGMMPAPTLTDGLVELPFFLTKDKAEGNPFGSAYGNLLPGDLVKSDENGRLTISPLSRMDILFGKAAGDHLSGAALTGGLSAAEIEYERQQVVGQVYEVRRDLLPAGAARFAQWALSDRMNFNEFNPLEYRANNRDGEDAIDHSPFAIGGKDGSVPTNKNMTGIDPYKPPGYPYNNTFSENDLHMLESTAREAGPRMPLEYQLDQGIPGLTDGYNAVVTEKGPEQLAELFRAESVDVYTDIYARLNNVAIEHNSLQLALTNAPKGKATFSPATQGAKLTANVYAGTEYSHADETLENALTVKYFDELQGLLVFEITDKAAYDKFLEQQGTSLAKNPLKIYAKYKKRGLAGVPTMLDWDGCQGVVSVLLTK